MVCFFTQPKLEVGTRMCEGLPKRSLSFVLQVIVNFNKISSWHVKVHEMSSSVSRKSL